jgi:hypothetical protein
VVELWVGVVQVQVALDLGEALTFPFKVTGYIQVRIADVCTTVVNHIQVTDPHAVPFAFWVPLQALVEVGCDRSIVHESFLLKLFLQA